MAKNQIQNERMLRYFLDSTKNIIQSEGIEALSVRSIADKAGYSYATIYNYYKDVKELTFMSACEFIDECKLFVLDFEYNTSDQKESIKMKAKKLSNYYIQYIGIYHLLYLTNSYNVGNIEALKNKLEEMHNSIFKNEFDNLFAERSNIYLNNLINLITGALLLYINRMTPNSYKDYLINLEKHIDILLKN